MNERMGMIACSLGLIGVLAVGAPALGQGRGGGGDPQQRVERQLDMLTEELSLSDEQRTQLEPVLLDTARKIQAAFNSSDGDRDAMRESMRTIHRENQKKVAAILDDRQMTRYREILEEHRKSKGRSKGNQGARPPQERRRRMGARSDGRRVGSRPRQRSSEPTSTDRPRPIVYLPIRSTASRRSRGPGISPTGRGATVSLHSLPSGIIRIAASGARTTHSAP